MPMMLNAKDKRNKQQNTLNVCKEMSKAKKNRHAIITFTQLLKQDQSWLKSISISKVSVGYFVICH